MQPEVGGHPRIAAPVKGSGGVRTGRGPSLMVGTLPRTINADRPRPSRRPARQSRRRAGLVRSGSDVRMRARVPRPRAETPLDDPPRSTMSRQTGPRSCARRPLAAGPRCRRPAAPEGPAGSADPGDVDARPPGPGPDGFRVRAGRRRAGWSRPVGDGRSTTPAGSTSPSGSRATGPSRPGSRSPSRRRGRPGSSGAGSRRLDLVKRLSDTDGDGGFEASEVVVEGVELPSASSLQGELYRLASAGWSAGRRRRRRPVRDPADPGRRPRPPSVRGLVGIDPRPRRLALPDRRRRRRPRLRPRRRRGSTSPGRAAVYRCRPDGSELALLASGFRDPSGGVAFDAGPRPDPGRRRGPTTARSSPGSA